MSRSSRSIVVAICFVTMAACGTSFADRVEQRQRKDTEFAGYQVTTKLWRGCVNVVTGWGELFRQPALSYTEDGLIAVPRGLINGVFMTVVRTGVGAYEAVFFPWPTEGVGYDPLLDPVYFWRN